MTTSTVTVTVTTDHYDQDRFVKDLLTPMHRIHTFPNGNSVYLGSQSAVGWDVAHSSEQLSLVKASLLSRNIRSIVCCAELYDYFRTTQDTEFGVAPKGTHSSASIDYLHIPMESNDQFNIEVSCYTAWPWVDKQLQDHSVLIHCNAGCHRSATVLVGYLSYRLSSSIPDSLQRVRSIRTCINLDNFIPQLESMFLPQHRTELTKKFITYSNPAPVPGCSDSGGRTFEGTFEGTTNERVKKKNK